MVGALFAFLLVFLVGEISAQNHQYVGCYRDMNFDISNTSHPNMSNYFCILFCTGKSLYAATTKGTECWCGNNKGTRAIESDCNISCPGTTANQCGSANSASVYQLGWTELFTVNVTIRDFKMKTHGGHIDFENKVGTESGIVGSLYSALGVDKKPVYAKETQTSVSTSSKYYFEEWFNTVPGSVNMQLNQNLTMVRYRNNVRFISNNFYPIDNQGYGNQNEAHNFAFTMELASSFTYRGNEVLTVEGSDDIFVYINNKLVIDLGGVHESQTSPTIFLNNTMLNIEVGGVYDFHLFFCERHTQTSSSLKIETTMFSTCGDGVIQEYEDCDGGACCSNQCTFKAATQVCRSSVGVCDLDDYCDGITSTCGADVVASQQTICRPVSGTCDVAEMCPGNSPDCPPDLFLPSSSVCRSASGACDVAETCDGVSRGCPDDKYAQNSTECRQKTDLCDVAEYCTGNNINCPIDSKANSSVVCRAQYDFCDKAERCDGVSEACPSDIFELPGVVCHNATNSCDTTTKCTGSSTCPRAVKPDNTSCTIDNNKCVSSTICSNGNCIGLATLCNTNGGFCNTTDGECICNNGNPYPNCETSVCGNGILEYGEQCEDDNACCSLCQFASNNTVCRQSYGECDVPEKCTGLNSVCPADSVSLVRTCRPANGPCDIAELCDGISRTCPMNYKRASNYVCRGNISFCDVAEYCTGSSDNCPIDTFKNNSEICREANGSCDVSEYCTGNSIDCPTDTFLPVNTECRAANGSCDVAEKCDGDSALCPADKYTSGIVCRLTDGPCDVSEICSGNEPNCPDDVFLSTTVLCQSSTGVCINDSYCTGQSATCPQNLLSGTPCSDNIPCTKNDTCQSGLCVGQRIQCDGGYCDDNDNRSSNSGKCLCENSSYTFPICMQSCSTFTCGANMTCTDDGKGTVYCDCKPGFSYTTLFDANLTSTAICMDLCKIGNGKCGPNRDCLNFWNGTTSCSSCHSGYKLVNNICTDSCNVINGGCDAMTTCTNNYNGSVVCGPCPPRFVSRNNVCINICNINNGGCDHRVKCNHSVSDVAPMRCGPCPAGTYGDPLVGCKLFCGDGTCNKSLSEDCLTCPSDCGSIGSCGVCGDGVCDQDENCPIDCPVTVIPTCNPPCGIHGTCDKVTCVCQGSWTGPTCSIEQSVPIRVAVQATPSFSMGHSVNTTANNTSSESEEEEEQEMFSVSIQKIQERTSTGQVVQEFIVSELDFDIVTIYDKSNTYYNYSSQLPNAAVVSVIMGHYEEPTTEVEFAGTIIVMTAHSMKFTFGVQNWPFQENTNTLVIIMDHSNDNQNSSMATNTDLNGNLQWFSLTVNQNILYAQFVDKAVIDGRSQIVTTKLSDDNSSVQIILPHFWYYAEMDPRFSVLLQDDEEEESEEEPTTESGSSNQEEKGKDKDGFDYVVLAYSLVASVVGVAIITAIFVKVILPRIQSRREVSKGAGRIKKHEQMNELDELNELKV